MSTFTYKYGSHTHEVGEVTDFVWERMAHTTERAQRDIAIYRVTLRGMFLVTEDSQTWTKLRDDVAAFVEAYSQNDVKFAVVNPDNTDSNHVLDPDTDPDITKGPYVTGWKYPQGTIEEMIAKREWEVTLECLRLEPESQIIKYEENVRHIGTCDMAWQSQNRVNGLPVSYPVYPATTQTIIQEGNSIGLEGYYLPGWVNNIWAGGAADTTVPFGVRVLGDQYEHKERRMQVLGKPVKVGRYFLYWPAKWKYTFEKGDAPALIPPA